MLEWLIIGGGIHGTALSHYLTHRLKNDSVRVLDPYPQPLARWHATTQNTGMVYLRSPEVHHLHYDPWSIRTFTETKRGKPHAAYIPIYNRPSLKLFNEYSNWLIEKYHLDTLRLQGRAIGLTYHGDHWRVESDQGQLAARRVVLAINTTENPRWPDWARNQPNIQHIFQPGYIRQDLPGHTVIVGGGITAAQVALTTASPVTLLMRHDIRVSHFDSDPCWVTSICLWKFHQEPDFNQRRRIIQQVRQPGSMPSDVADALQAAIKSGQVRLMRGDVVGYHEGDLLLADGTTLHADHVILATGFESARPGGAWLDDTIATLNLKTADCGYPIVNKQLCWHDGLYVVGRLAELEIGPVAGNIIGARLSSERLRGV